QGEIDSGRNRDHLAVLSLRAPLVQVEAWAPHARPSAQLLVAEREAEHVVQSAARLDGAAAQLAAERRELGMLRRQLQPRLLDLDGVRQTRGAERDARCRNGAACRYLLVAARVERGVACADRDVGGQHAVELLNVRHLDRTGEVGEANGTVSTQIEKRI